MNTPADPARAQTDGASSSRLVRIVRRLLMVGASLVTLIGLFYAVENWRGRRAWEAFQTEWEARGEHFDLAYYIPKVVPDEENFAISDMCFRPGGDFAVLVIVIDDDECARRTAFLAFDNRIGEERDGVPFRRMDRAAGDLFDQARLGHSFIVPQEESAHTSRQSRHSVYFK